MAAGFKRVYEVGPRYDKYMTGMVLLSEAMVVMFYFLYKIFFAEINPEFVGLPLLILFILIAVAVFRGVEWVGGRIKKKIRYEIAPDALVVGEGKTRMRYPYTSFEKVELDRFRFRDVLPIIFYVDGKKLLLNQYVDDIYELAHQILVHIGPTVPVEEAVIERIEAFRGLK